MRTVAIALGGVCGLLLSLAGSGRSAQAGDLPSYFNEIVGAEAASPAEIATKNILQLNTTMFELYADAGQVFRKNFHAKHPLILGLFSGAGGRFILYRPGMAPIDAPPVPIVYQLLKSVAHTMALGEVVVPYLNSPSDLTWRSALAGHTATGFNSRSTAWTQRPCGTTGTRTTAASCRTTSHSWTHV